MKEITDLQKTIMEELRLSVEGDRYKRKTAYPEMVSYSRMDKMKLVEKGTLIDLKA